MSQATFIVPDSDGTTFLANLNAALAAIQTGNVGTVDPSYKVAGMGWWRSDVPGAGVWTYYLYDGTAKTAFLTFDTGTHALGLASAVMDGLLGSSQGMIAKRGASAWAGLAAGAALYGLHVNAAGTDLEYRRNGWEKIADDVVPSGAGSVDITGIPAGVKHLEINFRLVPATNAVLLQGLFSVGASFLTAANYAYQLHQSATNAAASLAGAGAQTSFTLNSSTYPINNTTGMGGISGTIRISDVQNAAYPQATFVTAYGVDTLSSLYWGGYGSGIYASGGGPVDGLRLRFSSGNIASGRVSILGLRG